MITHIHALLANSILGQKKKTKTVKPDSKKKTISNQFWKSTCCCCVEKRK